MGDLPLSLPPRAMMQAALLEMGRRYWPRGAQLIEDYLGQGVQVNPACATEMQWKYVPLSRAARRWGVGSDQQLLVPACCVTPEGVDWVRAAFLLIHCFAEQAHEAVQGPIHSYSAHLPHHPDQFDYAWVNRIALVVRAEAAQAAGVQEDAAFGALPKGQIVLTHDVDAIYRPVILRLKQAAFDGYNVLRLVRRGDFAQLPSHLRRSMLKCFGPVRDQSVADALALNAAKDREAVFLIYAGRTAGRHGLVHRIFDPGYRIDTEEFSRIAQQLHADGHVLGLHPGFEAWRDTALLKSEAQALSYQLGTAPRAIRQHWLRFSFAETWKMQAEAGFRLDMTLGFNNRAGFRNAGALLYRPYNFRRNVFEDLHALPMILMDSHLYNYAQASDAPSANAYRADHWISEVKTVGGIASVNWHPHTLHPHYGWRVGYEDLLRQIGPGRLPAEIRDLL